MFILPNQEEMSSEFSKFNPIWLVFPLFKFVH